MIAQGGRRRTRKLSEEERELWESIARTARPLRRKPSPESAAARAIAPKPRSSPRVAESAGAIPAEKAEPWLEPLDRRLRQRLARGTEPIDARIDLHGRTQSEAHAGLLRFLRRAQGNGARYVLVITGKGGSSGERGVLKRQVPLWLKLSEFRPYVIGFETAHASHGGEGALYVRVRR
jgi:DNA-nicking Smr family endonuclease